MDNVIVPQGTFVFNGEEYSYAVENSHTQGTDGVVRVGFVQYHVYDSNGNEVTNQFTQDQIRQVAVTGEISGATSAGATNEGARTSPSSPSSSSAATGGQTGSPGTSSVGRSLDGVASDIDMGAAAANASSVSAGVVAAGGGSATGGVRAANGDNRGSGGGNESITDGDASAIPNAGTVNDGILGDDTTVMTDQLSRVVDATNELASVSREILNAINGDQREKDNARDTQRAEDKQSAAFDKFGKILLGIVTGKLMQDSLRNEMNDGRDPTVDNFVRDKMRDQVSSGVGVGITTALTAGETGAKAFGPMGAMAGLAVGAGAGLWQAYNTGRQMDIQRQQAEKQDAYTLNWMSRDIGYETNLATSQQFMRMGMQFDSVQGRTEALRSRAQRLRDGIYGDDGLSLEQFNKDRKPLADMLNDNNVFLTIGSGHGDKNDVMRRLRDTGKYSEEQLKLFSDNYSQENTKGDWSTLWRADEKAALRNVDRFDKLSATVGRKEDYTVREVSESMSAGTLKNFAINSPEAALIKQVVSEDQWRSFESRAKENGGIVSNSQDQVAKIQQGIVDDWNKGDRKDDSEKLGLRLRLTEGSSAQDREKMESRKKGMDSEAANLEREASIMSWQAKLNTLQMPDSSKLVDAYQSKGMTMGATVNAANVQDQMFGEMQRIREILKKLQLDYEKKGDNYDIKANNVTVNQVAA